jgi:hypothetical protein
MGKFCYHFDLSIAFQPLPVASLRPLLKVQVGRISISAYLAMT